MREVNNEMEECFRLMNDSLDYKIGNDFCNFDMCFYFIIFDEVMVFILILDKKEL